MRRPDPVLLAAQVAVLIGVPLLPVLQVAPNRLLAGHGVAVWPEAPAWTAFLAAAAVATGLRRVALPAAALLCVMLPLLAGSAAATIAAGLPKAARVSLGAGFWLSEAAAALALGRACGLAAIGAGPRAGLVGTIGAALILAASQGRFSALSLAREAAAQGPQFWAAGARHLTLVALALAGALALGIPAGLAAWRWRGLRAPLFGALTAIQTVPSVALFGLLMVPLTRAGLSGIGVIPAVTALTLYALLPVTRAVVTGFDGVAASVLDAARGMGMSAPQVTLGVRLPLAAPVLLAGLRVTVVQLMGLAVVAALIGAGGLGDFVFQGLGQYATDLVLLGALPAAGLALAADALLRAAAPGRAPR